MMAATSTATATIPHSDHNNDDDDSHVVVFNNTDAGSITSSYSAFSNLSSMLASKFPWLAQAAGGSLAGNNSMLHDGSSFVGSCSLLNDGAYLRNKQREIRVCLNGSAQDEVVNLWQLRQLALSRGGLCSFSTRKRAWPKLVGIHQDVLASCDNNSNRKPRVREATFRDMEQLDLDLDENVEWNIENHVTLARKQQAEDDALELQGDEDEKEDVSRKVSFAPSPPKLQVSSPDSSKQENNNPDSPPVDSFTTTSPIKDEEEDDDEPVLVSPMSGGGLAAGSPTRSALTPSKLRSSTSLGAVLGSPSRKHKVSLSLYEQGILRNVVVSVLRTPPPLPSKDDDVDDEDNVYCYFSGLHNLAALLLINLESPSLTNLTLSKLASFHLRDAMKPFLNGEFNLAIQVCTQSLLQELDPILHNYIVKESKVQSFGFLVNWVKTWFCQDVSQNNRIASRLVDVFLASHATMPIYVSLAIMTQPENRGAILSTPCSLRPMHLVLKSLPTLMVQDHEADPMEVWEDVIETAVSYIRQIPPLRLKELIQDGKTDTHHVASSCTMLEASPSWAVASTAPTDWALLQQAKQMRTKVGEWLPVEEACSENSSELQEIQNKYPLAMAASGLVVNKVNKWCRVAAMFAVGVMGVLFLTGSMYSLRSQRAVPVTVPNTEKKRTTVRIPRIPRSPKGAQKSVAKKPESIKSEKSKNPTIVKQRGVPISGQTEQAQKRTWSKAPERKRVEPEAHNADGASTETSRVTSMVVKAVESLTSVSNETKEPDVKKNEQVIKPVVAQLETVKNKKASNRLLAKRLKKVKELFGRKKKENDIAAKESGVKVMFGKLASLVKRGTNKSSSPMVEEPNKKGVSK